MTFRFLLLLWLACGNLAGFAHADEPMDPDLAFRLSARATPAGDAIEARWRIEPDYYLYRHKISFSSPDAGVVLGEAQLPKGKEKDDDFFGRVETYRDELRVRIPLVSGSAPFTLEAVSQGCWDGGVCYPPLTQQTVVALASAPAADFAGSGSQAPDILAAALAPPAASPAASAAVATPAAPSAAAPVAATPPASADVAPATSGDESGRIAELLRDSDLWLIAVSFFGFGLLLSFTPCVFPMIPILSGIIVNHGHAVTHWRAFTLSLSYVLGMAATYAAIGVIAGYSGGLLSAALQNAWVLGAFALVFVALSLSMFGFYELQLPAALQSRLSEKANRQGGSMPAIALMGALSALIVGPCVAAPLAGALLYIARTGDAFLGGAALFAMALGMGAPLLLVGVFSRSLLPKTGAWMDAVKKFFGVLLLATAFWLLTPVLPAWLVMLGWALLLIAPAIYMHALDPLPPQASGWKKLWKGFGVVMIIYGAALLVGLLAGARDPLQPLHVLAGGGGETETAPRFERVKSVAELDARLAAASTPVMLDFYADWCVSCKEMEKFTFSDAAVAAKMRQFTLLQADVTANNADDKALLKRFSLFGPPGIIFFNARGEEIAGQRVIGYQAPQPFLASLDAALAANRKAGAP